MSALEEEITHAGRGPGARAADHRGQPGVVHARRGTGSTRRSAGLEAMVSIDFYVNETTRHADVILPPTEPARARPLRHHLPPAGRARHGALVAGALPARARRRHDWEIARDLGAALLRARGRCGLRDRWSRATLRDRGAAAAQPAAAARRAAALVGCAAVGGQAREDDGRRRPRPAEAPAARAAGDARPADRPRCRPSWSRRCRACWTALSAARGCGEGELLLIGRRHQRDNNSWLHNSPRLDPGPARHALLAHPDDLAVRGIRDGDTVVGAVGGGGGARRGRGDRRRHARRGVAAARLRSRARRGAPAPRRASCPVCR